MAPVRGEGSRWTYLYPIGSLVYVALAVMVIHGLTADGLTADGMTQEA